MKHHITAMVGIPATTNAGARLACQCGWLSDLLLHDQVLPTWAEHLASGR